MQRKSGGGGNRSISVIPFDFINVPERHVPGLAASVLCGSGIPHTTHQMQCGNAPNGNGLRKDARRRSLHRLYGADLSGARWQNRLLKIKDGRPRGRCPHSDREAHRTSGPFDLDFSTDDPGCRILGIPGKRRDELRRHRLQASRNRLRGRGHLSKDPYQRCNIRQPADERRLDTVRQMWGPSIKPQQCLDRLSLVHRLVARGDVCE